MRTDYWKFDPKNYAVEDYIFVSQHSSSWTMNRVSRGKVKKITATGQIVVAYPGGSEKRFSNVGRCVGEQLLQSDWIISEEAYNNSITSQRERDAHTKMIRAINDLSAAAVRKADYTALLVQANAIVAMIETGITQ